MAFQKQLNYVRYDNKQFLNMLRVLYHWASAAQETPREEETKNRKEIFQTAVSLSSWAQGHEIGR